MYNYHNLTQRVKLPDRREYHAQRVKPKERAFLIACLKGESFTRCVALYDKCDPAYIRILWKRYPKAKRRFYDIAFAHDRRTAGESGRKAGDIYTG